MAIRMVNGPRPTSALSAFPKPATLSYETPEYVRDDRLSGSEQYLPKPALAP